MHPVHHITQFAWWSPLNVCRSYWWTVGFLVGNSLLRDLRTRRMGKIHVRPTAPLRCRYTKCLLLPRARLKPWKALHILPACCNCGAFEAYIALPSGPEPNICAGVSEVLQILAIMFTFHLLFSRLTCLVKCQKGWQSSAEASILN